MDTLFGMPVHVSRIPLTRPKLKLRPNVPVTDAFRKEMDAYLLGMFGEERYAIEFGSDAPFGLRGSLMLDEETVLRMQHQNERFL